MLHVEFIQDNRISFEDIESGGWIGNGVYEPSFTSDTQRYLEQKKAQKKVSELTGKPFREFNEDIKMSILQDDPYERYYADVIEERFVVMASANVFAVSGEFAPHLLNFLIIALRLIREIGAANAILICQ